MKLLGRTLLIVGALVLALLIGVLIGRGQRSVEPTEGSAAGMQITTVAPPSAPPPPLPAPPEAPKPAAVPKIAPDAQVQEDAAAVGMTTREAPEGDASAPPKSTASGDGDTTAA